MKLDRSGGVPLRAQLEQQLRELVRAGRLVPGAALPSSRTLAGDLGVSRRLVVEAYAQLTAEGYLVAEERSGTRVGTVSAAGAPGAPEEPRPPGYDLRPGIPSLSHFPRRPWLKAAADALRLAPGAVLAYPDPRGSPEFRGAIAEYLRRVRAVAADPGRILICAGFTQALSLLATALGHPLIGLENPGLVGRDRVVTAAGGAYLPIPVDQEGMRIEPLREAAVDAAVVAPAHQFPLGVTLSPARRSGLLDWARAGGLVIEDDYDAEFRYDRLPIGALHGLAPDRVAYVGTVSKTLAPALRLGWIVLPDRVLDAVVEAKRDHDLGSPMLEQLTLARMLHSGAYERHLRAMRREYRRRRDNLIAELHRQLPGARVSGLAAGLHLMVQLPEGADAAAVTSAARRLGLGLASLERYTLGEMAGPYRSLVIGYGNISLPAIGGAVHRLAQAIRATRG